MQTGFTNMLGILGPGRMDDQGQSPELIRRGRIEDMKINPGNYTPSLRDGLLPGGVTPRGGSAFMDMRDRSMDRPKTAEGLMQPNFNMGVGIAGGSGNLQDGMLFLPDKDNLRTEEQIRNSYEKARADAARQRREGFLGQVVLPGEQSFEEFSNFNQYNYKRNPNLPDSAYKDFDMSGVIGFDPVDTTIDDASKKGLPETNQPPLQQEALPSQKDRLGIESLQRQNQNPYQNNNANMSNFKNMENLLQNIDGGIQSLIDNSSYMQNNNNLSQFPFSNSSSPNFMGGDILKWSSYK